MNNLEIYNRFAAPPESAKKQIAAGRLKGMTDINPMWRIRCLTEAFGPAGIGWYTAITRRWIDEGADGVKIASVEIELYVKADGEWSKPIIGIGGSSFVANERGGAYTSDEAYKMAYTDALSVACKALGFGADVYWQGGRTKYTAAQSAPQAAPAPKQSPKAADAPILCADCNKIIDARGNFSAQEVAEKTRRSYGRCLCWDCAIKARAEKEQK